jgi:hypothetical protein
MTSRLATTDSESDTANDLIESTASEQPAGFKYSEGFSLPEEFTDHTRISATTQDWIESISEAWQTTFYGVLETGKRLRQAKKALPYGDFGRMIEDKLPFSARTAQMPMKIAEDARIARLDAKHVSLLPPHWGTLHAIPRIHALIDGVPDRSEIVPGMAHFRNTGPIGTVCRQCVYWDEKGGRMLDKKPCTRFCQLCGYVGPLVNGGTPSCKYFERTNRSR